ncbi:PEP-CTERM sorting domain-containing protein [Lacipirellula parvula]|uniref:Ice-binding protein C-terminal domain-containing protein n=1 Tax=Lacipirellula parvula TaxID=2650471 RepID=A0A5K7XG64_9BACT|nr:PEP-CTERM sorting domain-containing protein [Lacipirellula parvula]BBO33881.1 hypothetical protein PLANPX_3493 [Lacipirellula parvula]
MTPNLIPRLLLAAIAACGGVSLLPSTAHAVPISIFNTGTDPSNNAWPGIGVPDIHYFYTLSQTTGVPVTVDHTNWPIFGGPWVPNNPNSRWIGPNANSQGPAGAYTYATQFTLPPLTNLSTVSVSGLWATDDPGVNIEINNISTGQLSAGFTTLVPFSITSGFQIGVNTIEFLVSNAGGPTGLRVDKVVGSYQLVPEPATIALGGMALVGVVALRRRGRTASL